MSTPYARGRRFEQTVEGALRRGGWIILRSAGSKEPVDLIAWRPSPTPPRRIIAIQCRRNGKMAPAERAAVLAFCEGLTPEIYVVRVNRRRLQARHLLSWNGGWGALSSWL